MLGTSITPVSDPSLSLSLINKQHEASVAVKPNSPSFLHRLRITTRPGASVPSESKAIKLVQARRQQREPAEEKVTSLYVM